MSLVETYRKLKARDDGPWGNGRWGRRSIIALLCLLWMYVWALPTVALAVSGYPQLFIATPIVGPALAWGTYWFSIWERSKLAKSYNDRWESK